MKNPILGIPIVLAGLIPCAAGFGAEIPSDPAAPVQEAVWMEQAGLPASEFAALDRTELAEFALSDPARQGGDAIVTVAMIAAIVVLIYLLIEHMDHKHL